MTETETETTPVAETAPAQTYRCAAGHTTTTTEPFTLNFFQKSEIGSLVYNTAPLCIACLGTKLDKIAAMETVEGETAAAPNIDPEVLKQVRAAATAEYGDQ